jgi:hypothetical protein
LARDSSLISTSVAPRRSRHGWGIALFGGLKRVRANTPCHHHANGPRRGGLSSPWRPSQNFRISRTRSGRFRIIRIGEGALTTRPSPPLRNVSCSPGGRGTRRAETARLEPCPPGNFGKEIDRNETRFLEKTPPGSRRRYGRKWPGAQRTLLLPFHRGRTDIIGTGLVIVFSFLTDFFPRGPLRPANDANCGSLVQPASIRYRVGPAREPFGRSWSSGHQFIGGDQQVVSDFRRRVRSVQTPVAALIRSRVTSPGSLVPLHLG